MRRRDLLAGFGGVALAPLAARLPEFGSVRAAQEATSSASGDAGSLGGMLALAPDILAGANPPNTQIAMYANPARQLAALGEPPGGHDLPAWMNATYWLSFPSGIGEFAREPRWRATFGFEARQVDQALEIGQPPRRVKHLRGRFDPEELRAAWTASGYSPVDIAGADAFSWADEPVHDFDSDVTLLGIGSFNNVAILPDGSLLFTGSLAELREAVAAASGESPGLGADPGIADIVAVLDPDLATGYILTAEAVRALAIADESDPVSDEQAAVIEVQVVGTGGPMPKPELIAVGATAGGPWPTPSGNEATPRPLPPDVPLSESEIALLFANMDDAEAAIPIIDTRLADGQSLIARVPYREFFPTWEIRLDSASPALVVRLVSSPQDRPGRILDMLAQRDLLFLSWTD